MVAVPFQILNPVLSNTSNLTNKLNMASTRQGRAIIHQNGHGVTNAVVRSNTGCTPVMDLIELPAYTC